MCQVDGDVDDQKLSKKRAAASDSGGGSGAIEAPKKSRFDVLEKNGGGDQKEDAAMSASLSSTQIKLMMAHAQREIEERKRALSNLRDKDPLLASVPSIGMPVALATQALSKKPTPEDSEKARKIAELQAQIRAKLTGNLANLIQPNAVAAAAAAAAQAQERPKPLILDEEGRTVDKSGRTINIPTVTPTLKANIRAKKREVFQRQTGLGERSESGTSAQEEAIKYFDDRIAQKPTVRNKRTLRFHEPGKFQQLAERMRMKSQLERLQNEISQIARKTGISSATKLALIAPKQDMPDDVPAMEWWDSVILTQDLETLDEESGKISIRQTAISNLIEHPTQMKPPNEPMKPVYLPVFLTKKERKKLRRQNRREAWKEEQEKIRLGLVAPPEPKLRISNLMRVLGSEAVQDPTKMEQHVREQMAKRQKAHEDANNARKLTSEQKSEKKQRKLREDTSCGVHVSVYRIRDLQDNQSKKFKVETNAKQLQMTGSVVLFRDCCVVVVEGGPKQQKKYRRLMLTRIKWEEDLAKGNDGQDVPNSCVLVWEGTSQRRHFGEIKFKIFPMEKMAREFFQKHQVEHYWDLAYSGAVLEASTDQQ
ncbi:U4/U6 small nuclear ribonucleoprotein Prp3 isoform X2 [Drosophila gunungcola]|uniref:U4/U6 small nuclear ribonucleoprotein Prp3 isoform X2 n=1 Tax=Drosophila elegans TaxID=30023 RepID=UPI0007E87815|nr:U4/U6 small nuclear ribonucleoprotein Prp3 isoform X2 [Drosophila elegans]XP_052848613.1 U4/U6 small nuclear ribonucleoprotein Prp3 isoform X2 [Drosophila gunungcola]